ncbi:hypothetical protein ONZ45_g17553 [Pleurotus djamor]|nr:hypothetical protein ONZ45_g17553 [Pleurotus djamor]
MLFSTTTTTSSSSIESFPYRARVKGCLLISPFTPPKHHPTYTKGMSWATYITFAVAPYIPFNILGRLVKPIMARQTKTYEDAGRMVNMVFDRMSGEEKERLRGGRRRVGGRRERLGKR